MYRKRVKSTPRPVDAIMSSRECGLGMATDSTRRYSTPTASPSVGPISAIAL